MQYDMAQIIKTDGTITEVQPKNGRDFTLEELQRIVKGYIEVVQLPYSDGQIMIINEEGKLEGLPTNDAATQLAWRHGGIDTRDYIVGDALLCDDKEVR